MPKKKRPLGDTITFRLVKLTGDALAARVGMSELDDLDRECLKAASALARLLSYLEEKKIARVR